MVLTNAERQKRYREKRNGLARAAAAAPAAVELDETGDYPFVMMLKEHWGVGAKRFLIECGPASTVERQILSEIPENRPTAVDLLDIVEKAGEVWAAQRLLTLLREELQPRKPGRGGRKA